MQAKWIWAVLGVVYAAFFSWYTSFGGPLTPEEIDHFVALIAENGEQRGPEREALLRNFLESDTGDDFVMVNVIEMHATPLQVDGVEEGESSEDVLAKYMEYMMPALLSRASHPVFYGAAASPALEMFGVEGMRDWTTGAGMRYRSRRDMMEIASNPAFQGSHEFKIASINKTIAFPIDPWVNAGDPRLLLALILGLLGCALGWIAARRAPREAQSRVQ